MTPVATLPAEVQELRDRLLRDQAPKAKTRTDYFDQPTLRARLGNPYSGRGPSLEQMYEMRGDAILRFADLVAMSSILMGNWHIECKNARLAAFVDRALRRVIGRLTIQFFGARHFGYQGLVKEFATIQPSWEYIDRTTPGDPQVKKVWTDEKVDALVWDSFVPLRPEQIEPTWDAGNNFSGIKIRNANGGFRLQGAVPIINPATKQPGDVQVDLDHSLWVVNERDEQFNSVWGKSRFAYAFKFWRAYEITLSILTRSIERKGDPTIIVSYPPGDSVLPDGSKRDNQLIAEEIGEAARSGSVIVVPSDIWGDDVDKGTGQAKWKIETVDNKHEFSELQSILGYFDVQKFRAMNVSELSVIEGSGGTSSRNVAATTAERTAEAQFYTQLEHDEIINRYMIPQLVRANFWEPEIRNEPIRKVTETFGEGNVALMQTLLESFANANSDKLPIDWDAMLGLLKVPSRDLSDVVAAEKKLAQQAETSTPQPVAPDNAGNAGVSDTGFYYGARDVIELAEDENFLSGLPDTKHYKDRAILAQTRLIRKTWSDLLAAQYEDFAKKVASAKLEDVLLEDEPTEHPLVKGWRYSAKAYTAALSVTVGALKKIFARAGKLELSSSNLDGSDWKPDEKELAKWIEENAAAMVRKVDETTRKQLNTFLTAEAKANKNAPQIADGLRQHFSDFPARRADLIAREEVRKFYNAATLFASQAVDAKQVQALDARLGAERSDPECIARNGRFFSVEDAFKEEAKTHPRDTLAWRIIGRKAGLSIERVGQEEAGFVGARLDKEQGIIYLTEELTPEDEGRYLCQVGQWLQSVD